MRIIRYYLATLLWLFGGYVVGSTLGRYVLIPLAGVKASEIGLTNGLSIFVGVLGACGCVIQNRLLRRHPRLAIGTPFVLVLVLLSVAGAPRIFHVACNELDCVPRQWWRWRRCCPVARTCKVIHSQIIEQTVKHSEALEGFWDFCGRCLLATCLLCPEHVPLSGNEVGSDGYLDVDREHGQGCCCCR